MSIYKQENDVLVFKDLFNKYSMEIHEQILKRNTIRIKKVLFILLLVNSILVLSDFLHINKTWCFIPASRNVFFLHLGLLPILFIYFSLYRIRFESNNIYRYINLSFNFSIIVWAELLSLNTHALYDQISAYMIVMFCLSALYIFTPVQSIIMFPGSFITFVAAILIMNVSTSIPFVHILNSLLITLICLLVSIVSYTTFRKYVVNEQIIKNKNREIDLLNNELICKVQSQTDELIKINSSLELEKLRVSLFSNISHEFKTPINVILSAEQLLEYKLKDDQSQIPASSIKKYMFSIKQNCYRLIRLVSNIIDINTIDCGSMNLYPENKDIVKVTEDIVLSVADYVKDKNISLIFDTEMEEKVIALDQDKIERVILNLLSNAMKFTPPGGSITVNIYDHNENVAISVKDTGIGIPTELQSAIFDRLVQVDRSFTKRSEGSGIGLSIAKSIIDIHKGNIYVNSKLGTGSEFVVELPVYTIDGAATEVAAVMEQDRIEKIKIEFSDIYL